MVLTLINTSLQRFVFNSLQVYLISTVSDKMRVAIILAGAVRWGTEDKVVDFVDFIGRGGLDVNGVTTALVQASGVVNPDSLAWVRSASVVIIESGIDNSVTRRKSWGSSGTGGKA
jgi:hypothetical protein